MKMKTLVVLMGVVLLFFTFPSFSSISEQKASNENTQMVDSSLSAINLQNTLTAYISEVNESARYAAYSDQAWSEGHKEIATLFDAISCSSKIHAKRHKAILKKAGQLVPKVKPKFNVKSTKENVQEALANESRLISKLYPKCIVCAFKTHHQRCYECMCSDLMISKKHKAYFEKALDAMEKYNDKLLSASYFVCPDCGNTYENKVQVFCPYCQTHYQSYLEISN